MEARQNGLQAAIGKMKEDANLEILHTNQEILDACKGYAEEYTAVAAVC